VGGTVGTVGIPVGDGVTGSAVGAAVFVGAPVVGDLVGGQVDVGLGAWDGGGVVGSGVTYQDHGSTESMNCCEYSPSVLPIAEAISFTSFFARLGIRCWIWQVRGHGTPLSKPRFADMPACTLIVECSIVIGCQRAARLSSVGT